MQAAVVTGSSSGIGLAIAKRLLRAGYGVTLNYSRDDVRAKTALADCRQISETAILVKADVSDLQGASTVVGRTVEEFGSVDVLINNAAVVIDRPALDMTEEEWDRVIAVNMKGAFLCAQLAARQMVLQAEGGVILNIGASTGIRGRRNGINTCASKAGLMIMTQCLALELGPKIRVNTVVPGLSLTDETEQRFGLDNEKVRRERERGIPLGRLGTPEDIADAVLLLLSDEAGFVTGQKFVIDGGQYMW